MHRALLVLGLLAAVYLRVPEGVGEEEVVLQAIVIVVHHVLAKVTARVPHGAEGLANVVQRDDIGGQNIGAAPKLTPTLLVPDLAVPALLL